MIKNSVNTPTVSDIKNKIKDLIKDAPENWIELLAQKSGKKINTVKSYLYNGRGSKKQLGPLLKYMNEIVDEFNTELKEELAK